MKHTLALIPALLLAPLAALQGTEIVFSIAAWCRETNAPMLESNANPGRARLLPQQLTIVE